MARSKEKEIYIAANEEPTRLKQFLNMVANYAGIKLYYGLPPKLANLILRIKGGIGGSSANETILLFTKNWFYSVEKLKSLGWRQEIKIKESIKEVVDWLMDGFSN